MKEKTKRSITSAYSILLIILAAVFTVMTVMPIVAFDASKIDYGSEYYTGSFTANMNAPDELEIGLISAVDFVRHFRDVQTIAKVQAGNATVDEAERERLAEKLDEDKSFTNSVLLFYMFGGFVDEESEDESDSSFDIRLILGVIFIVSCIITGIVYSIIIIIKFIVLLVKSLKHFKDDTDKDIDNRMDKFPFAFYTPMMLMFYMLYSLVSSKVSMGLALKGAMIIFVVVCLIRAIKTLLFSEKKDMVAVMVKQAITIVSIVAVVMLMFNFIGVDLINEFSDVSSDIQDMYYEAELEKITEATEDSNPTVAAKTARTVVGINALITFGVAFVGAIMMLVAAVSSVERFANKKTKLKTGELVPYKAMIVLAAVVLVFAIVPTVFAVGSEEARDEAFKAGQFKIWYTEYQEEGTMMNLEYQVAKEISEEGGEELAELREELEKADPESEQAELLKEQIEDGEKLLAEADETVKEIEARAKRPTNCVIFAVLFLAAEIAYLVVPKVLSKNKKEEEPAVEAEIVE